MQKIINPVRNGIKKIKPSNWVGKSESGFTLIELLVVIGIIAVLATIGTISFGNAAAKSRNAKRQADIKTISSGLQIYNTQKGNYPVVGNVPAGTDRVEWAAFLNLLGVGGTTPPRMNGGTSGVGEEYCYYTNDATNPTAYILVATDFENKGSIPTDAITDTTGFSPIFDSGQNTTDNTVACIGRSAPLSCTAAGGDGADGSDYCIKSGSSVTL
jgi:prepilin-type N-terminal cleavage/methylation domain-containing protein